MAEFTKEPWRLDSIGTYIRVDDGSERILASLSMAKTHEEELANGRLMAAAPKMYKLLRMAMQSLRHHSDHDRIIAYRIKKLLARIDEKEKNNE